MASFVIVLDGTSCTAADVAEGVAKATSVYPTTNQYLRVCEREEGQEVVVMAHIPHQAPTGLLLTSVHVPSTNSIRSLIQDDLVTRRMGVEAEDIVLHMFRADEEDG
ncbi:hypothetical protein M422DRAFT_277404 [Sphaerobolus stellatus SS14]|uniref:Uncharacterized protein n=1 Tax=Sphaerobolus stellatus (strain SS14) TaxID=990650 RepID=A0A0C9TZX8_SPHS4|nr:hypothetical protein M422DRAFT_277404 [Sphaerobolus stellatus SS14]